MIQLRLFYEFLKIGLFAVGGGMAALPFIQDMAERTGWCTSAQIADMLAVSESTPGPIGINMATYVGFEVGGITGALAATLGVVIPGVIIVILDGDNRQVPRKQARRRCLLRTAARIDGIDCRCGDFGLRNYVFKLRLVRGDREYRKPFQP